MLPRSSLAVLGVVVATAGCARGAATGGLSSDGPVERVRVPDVASTAETRQRDPEPADEGPDAVAMAPEPEAAPSAATPCTVRVQIQDAGVFRGVGSSSTDADRASLAAWEQACRAVLDATGIDCHDTARVRVASISASTRMVMTQGSVHNEHEQTIELVTFHEATGASSAGTHHEACQRAMDDACRAAIGRTCPPAGVRLVEVDGTPTYDDGWTPPATESADRITI